MLCSTLFLNSEQVFQKLLQEGDYYRSAGEYKRAAFDNGIKDTAVYYLDLAAIYSLSDFTDIADTMYEKATYFVDSEENLRKLVLINSYLSFRNGAFSEALFDIEDYMQPGDTLIEALTLLRQCVKENKKVEIIPEFLPDSIKRSVNHFRKLTLRDPIMGIMMSSIYPGLGEVYAGDNVTAIRDFTVYTVFLGVTVYALLKNRASFSVDPIALSLDYILKRDWVLVLFLYNSFVARFANGAKVNAEEAIDSYNKKKYEKYLTGLYNYIEKHYRERIVSAITF